MQEADLAFYTTQELIKELVRRSTFLGVIVHSEQEMRGKDWGQERMFKVHFNSNLSATEASRLLDVVAEHMDRHAC